MSVEIPTHRPKQLPVDPKLQFSRPPAPGSFFSGAQTFARVKKSTGEKAPMPSMLPMPPKELFCFSAGRPSAPRLGSARLGARSLGRNFDKLGEKSAPLDGRNQGRNQRLESVPYIDAYCAPLYMLLLWVTL